MLSGVSLQDGYSLRESWPLSSFLGMAPSFQWQSDKLNPENLFVHVFFCGIFNLSLGDT